MLKKGLWCWKGGKPSDSPCFGTPGGFPLTICSILASHHGRSRCQPEEQSRARRSRSPGSVCKPGCQRFPGCKLQKKSGKCIFVCPGRELETRGMRLTWHCVKVLPWNWIPSIIWKASQLYSESGLPHFNHFEPVVLESFLLITYYSKITSFLCPSADFKATIPLSLKLKSLVVFYTYNLYEEIENNSWPFSPGVLLELYQSCSHLRGHRVSWYK